MLSLKLGMNRGRLLNSNLLTGSDKLTIIRWNNSSCKQYHTKADRKNKINIRDILRYILLLHILIVSAIAFVANLSEGMDETTTYMDDSIDNASNDNTSMDKNIKDISAEEKTKIPETSIWTKLFGG